MSLQTLANEVLETIVNLVDIDDKTSLFMTGNKLLCTKLASLSVNILILPHDDVAGYVLSENDDGFHAEIIMSTCKNMDESIDFLYKDKSDRTYTLVPLYYRNAKCATIHDAHLELTLMTLQKLTRLNVYMHRGLIKHLSKVPITLTEMNITIRTNCNLYELVRSLPSTLLSLTLHYDTIKRGNDNIVYLGAKLLAKLPPNLHILIGIGVYDGHDVSKLPKSLARLECNQLHESTGKLPDTITCLVTDYIDMSQISHLQLETLLCTVSHTADLLSLQHLRYLHVTLHRNPIVAHLNNWINPVMFPHSLTELFLDSLYSLCCVVPPSVTKLTLCGRYNVFQQADNVWKYNEWELRNVPDNVKHADIQLQVLHDNDYDLLVSKCSMMETLRVTVGFTAEATLRIWDMDKFTKCTTLLLPRNIMVASFSPCILAIDADYIHSIPVLLKSLWYIRTLTDLSTTSVRNAPSLRYLECGYWSVVRDLACMENIKQVVLVVDMSKGIINKDALPVLPANAQYKYINE